MSELKVYSQCYDGTDGLFYLKSEADEVIDELKVKLRVQTSNAEDAWKLKDSYHSSYAEAVKELYEKNKEIAQLQAMLEERNKQVTGLKEERCWRKYPEEKPQKGQKVLFRAKYKSDNVRTWIGEFRNVDFDVFFASAPGWGCEFLPNEIFGWMPLPSAPKED